MIYIYTYITLLKRKYENINIFKGKIFNIFYVFIHRGDREVPHQPKICLLPPPGIILPLDHPPPHLSFIPLFPSHLESILPPTKQKNLSYNPIKMSFFAVVTATVSILF